MCCGYTHNDSVVPSKNCKLIQACDQVPARSDVPSDEDSESQNRERVHELACRVR